MIVTFSFTNKVIINLFQTLNVELGHRRKLQKEIAHSRRPIPSHTVAQPRYGLVPLQRLAGDPPRSIDQSEAPKKRGYRHHPKPDLNAPERPYSAYVLFSNYIRDQLKAQDLSFTKLSKYVGEKWQNLSAAEKEAWKQKGAGPWEEYKAKVAEYQKTDQYQQYQKYLADFRAGQTMKSGSISSSTHARSGTFGTQEFNLRGPASSSAKLGRSDSSSPGQLDSVEIDAKRGRKRSRTIESPSVQSENVKNTRARRACKRCQQRKIRCSGHRPKCVHCEKTGEECTYPETKGSKQTG